VKKMTYLATATFLAMLILVPSALAQNLYAGDHDPFSPEPNAVVESDAQLQQEAGQPEPPPPTTEPVPGPDQPSSGAPLPKTGGPEIVGLLPMVLSGSVLFLVGLAVLARRVLWSR
jgi:hypothetical protein